MSAAARLRRLAAPLGQVGVASRAQVLQFVA